MIINLPTLLLGVALLWFPRSWMRLGTAFLRRRRRKTDNSATEPWKTRTPGDPRLSFGIEFSKLRNYVDLARGLAGGLVLMGGLGFTASIQVAPDAAHSASLRALAMRVGIMFIGVAIQMIRYEHRKVTFYPPVFFIAGLSVALCDARSAAFAFVMIWTINTALANAQAFLTVYALLLVVFGYFFGHTGTLMVIFTGVLCFLPVLASLLSNRPLVVFSRKTSHAGN